MMPRVVLLDVGGTLWPDGMVEPRGVDPRLEALGRLLPDVAPEVALAALRARLQTEDDQLEQRTHTLIDEVLRELTSDQVDAVAVRRALCGPAYPMFPGAEELLKGIKQLGLKTIIVSNVQVRGAREYRADFASFGVGHCVDAVVTSLEVGFKKPHLAMFEAALQQAGYTAEQAIMVGNSEAKDIESARKLGMRTIRVAIEEPAPTRSAADAVVTSLDAAAETIALWVENQERL